MTVDALLRTREVAERLSVTGRTVRAMIARGDLAAVRVGRLLRVTPESVEAFLKRRVVRES